MSVLGVFMQRCVALFYNAVVCTSSIQFTAVEERGDFDQLSLTLSYVYITSVDVWPVIG